MRTVGYIERSLVPGQYRVVPGSGASWPVERLRRRIVYEGFQSPRDVELFVLVTWSGVLARRLVRSERRRASSRLRALLAAPPSQYSDLAPIAPIAAAIGSVACREEMDMVREMVVDLVSGDPISLDLGGSGGDGDSGGGGGGGGGGDSS